MTLVSETLILDTAPQPDSFVPPTASLTLTDPQREKATVTVAASAVENSNPNTGLTALIAAVKTAGDALLATYGVDVVGNNVEAQYEIKNVVRDNGASIYSDTDDLLVSADIIWAKV